MSKKDKAVMYAEVVLCMVVVAAILYQTVAFYTYPCQAFKSGYLGIGYAPARCVK